MTRGAEEHLKLAEGTVYYRDYSALAESVGSETMNPHWAVLLSSTPWAEEFKTVAMAPITSAFEKKHHKERDEETRRRKTLFRSVPLTQHEMAQLDAARRPLAEYDQSLLLVAEVDTLSSDDLSSLIRASHAHATGGLLPSTLLARVRANLSSILIGSKTNIRTRYRLGDVRVAPGDVVLLKEYCTASVAPWLVVSSDLWLELLAHRLRRTDGLKGLVRSIIAVAPIFAGPSEDSDDLVVRVPTGQDWLPEGGHCPFFFVRTRSTARIERVVGQVENDVLMEVGAGLESFFGLQEP